MSRFVFLCVVAVLLVICAGPARGGDTDRSVQYKEFARRLLETGLRDGEAYAMLHEITSSARYRLSGSAGAATAIELTMHMMMKRGFEKVQAESLLVPHWERGTTEEAIIMPTVKRKAISLSVCALGGSVATPKDGVTGEVVEVHSFEELQNPDLDTRGKIIFFNRPMDPTKLNTFEAYGGAVDQRSRGAIEAARAGAVAAIVRSMTLAFDDVPHTGAMGYQDSIPKVPAAAVSTVGADQLSRLLKMDPGLKVRLKLSCRTLPDIPSANVLGEVRGALSPDEIIVVGGHLDCWDKGAGAHDDAAGCVQAMEVINILKKLHLRPKKTIRAVLFMNEENGNRGGKAYPVAVTRQGEKQIAAIESDRGGFMPLGFSFQGDSLLFEKISRWGAVFEEMGMGKIEKGYSGVDVSPTVQQGVPGFGLLVESQRYFDYHHSDNDTIDKVNPRELELGAVAEALLCYLISEEGL